MASRPARAPGAAWLRIAAGAHADRLDDDASITRAYEAGATDFFVKSTQWSLLAGRLRYLLRASRTRVELERSKSRLARAQDLARMGSFDWKRGGGGPIFSAEGLRVFGLGPGDALDFRALLRMLPEDERGAFVELLHDAMANSTVLATDLSAKLIDGRQRIVHIEAEPEFNEHGTLVGYTGIVQDVTDRRMAEDRIRHLANFDTLTGLPNRRQLIWRAERALEQGRRLNHQVALLLIDLDRFKVINDTLGHGAGDELLMEVSRRLRSCVRHSDQVLESSLESMGARSHRSLEAVGRLGGDEFVALLPEVVDERDAERVASRILDLMRQPIIVMGQECFVTASVGIALFPRDGTNVVDLLRNSDVAMYSVKSAGRNAASLYHPMLAGQGREKIELESALHKAIERHELVLHYQPKVDVRAAKMVGVEALMRWRRNGVLVRRRLSSRLPKKPASSRRSANGRSEKRAPGPCLAGQLRLCRVDRGEPAESAVRAHRPGRVHPQRRDDIRGSASRHRARDHRDGPDEGPAERHSRRCTGSMRSVSRSRSTTSGPATRRSPT
jgi:GGDEF domain-containing protein/PAS domain-containing protein